MFPSVKFFALNFAFLHLLVLFQSKIPRKGAIMKKQINETADRFDPIDAY